MSSDYESLSQIKQSDEQCQDNLNYPKIKKANSVKHVIIKQELDKIEKLMTDKGDQQIVKVEDTGIINKKFDNLMATIDESEKKVNPNIHCGSIWGGFGTIIPFAMVAAGAMGDLGNDFPCVVASDSQGNYMDHPLDVRGMDPEIYNNSLLITNVTKQFRILAILYAIIGGLSIMDAVGKWYFATKGIEPPKSFVLYSTLSFFYMIGVYITYGVQRFSTPGTICSRSTDDQVQSLEQFYIPFAGSMVAITFFLLSGIFLILIFCLGGYCIKMKTKKQTF